MKRLAALGALATVTLLAGCATGDGYYSGAYGYSSYPAYAYDDGYYPYYDNYGYPYAYGPSLGVGLGFGYSDYGGYRNYRGYRGGYAYRDGGRRFDGDRHFQGRPSSPPAAGLGPQAVGPQGRAASGAAVAPRQRSGGMGRPRQG